MLSCPRVIALKTGGFLIAVAHVADGCSRAPGWHTASGAKMNGPLIAASAMMVAAWEYLKASLVDASLDRAPWSEDIRRGFRIFTDTPREAPKLAPGGMSCSNCHMNGGQREKSLPLVGVAGMFPEVQQALRSAFSASAIASPTASFEAKTPQGER
jgi:hypothetical protein